MTPQQQQHTSLASTQVFLSGQPSNLSASQSDLTPPNIVVENMAGSEPAENCVASYQEYWMTSSNVTLPASIKNF